MNFRRLLPPAIVVVVTLVAFFPSLRGDFLHWDDDKNFIENPAYRGLALENLKWMFTTFHMGHYHPLTWMTLGADYVVWGMNPLGYHLTALLLHAAVAVLLYGVLLALLGLAGRPDSRIPAAVGALFAAIHPLRVESVAWITERRDVLCGVFTLLSVLFYLKRVEEERQGRTRNLWLILSLAAFGASLLSKALSIALPAVLLILDLYPLRRFAPGSRARILLEKLPYALLSCADAVIMIFAMKGIDAVRSSTSYNLIERIVQSAYGLCFYVVKTAWPSGLAPLYPVDPKMNPLALPYLAAMAATVAIVVLLVLRRKSWPWAAAAGAAYAILVSPVLGLVVTGRQIAADRYTYLALLPASALLAGGLCRLDGRRARFATLASAAALLFLGALTFRQSGFWRDSITLWTREIDLEPSCALAWQNRGCAHLARGNLSSALADLSRSLALDPQPTSAWHDRGTVRSMLGDHEGAIEDFTHAIQLDPGLGPTFAARAVSRMRLGRLDPALADSEEAVRLDPKIAVTFASRGQVRFARRDYRGAVEDYTRAIQAAPTSPEMHGNRGLAHSEMGDYRQAVRDFTRSLELRPSHVDTRVRRAIAYTFLNDPRAALADYDEVLRARPDAGTFARRAAVRGNLGDLDGVVADATEAIRLKPDLYDAYVYRGGARMTRGHREEAAQDFARALELAPAGWPLRPQVENFLKEARAPK